MCHPNISGKRLGGGCRDTSVRDGVQTRAGIVDMKDQPASHAYLLPSLKSKER
jgi:hypothetical protein